MTRETPDELSRPPAGSPSWGRSKLAAIWFSFVGPGAVLYAGWVGVIDRHYFSRWLVLPLAVLYLAYAAWTYRLGKEHLALKWTWRGWVARIAFLVGLTGPFIIIYAPAFGVALGLSIVLDALWSRLRPPSTRRRSHLGTMGTLLAFGLLFPLANRAYLIHGAFFTFFASEPPRLMPNPLFDIDARGFRGPGVENWESDAATILLLGDSVSWGFPYAWEDSFARHLGDRLRERGLQVNLLNAAIPSQSIVQIEARLPELLDYEPSVAILMVGYQWTRSVEHRERLDVRRPLRWMPRTEWVFVPPFLPEMMHLGPRMILRGLTGTMERWQDAKANREQFRVALEGTVRALREAEAEVLFAGHPAMGLDEGIDALIRREAARSGSRFVDVRAVFEMGGQYAFADEIHPDRSGHERIAELLVEPVTQMLSRRVGRNRPR